MVVKGGVSVSLTGMDALFSGDDDVDFKQLTDSIINNRPVVAKGVPSEVITNFEKSMEEFIGPTDTPKPAAKTQPKVYAPQPTKSYDPPAVVAAPQSYPQPPTQQSYPQQPYAQQPYAQQPYPQQPYAQPQPIGGDQYIRHGPYRPIDTKTQEEEDYCRDQILEQICSYRRQLSDNNINTDGIAIESESMPLNELHRIYTRLRIRATRTRCSDIIDSILVSGASAMELIFNGKREIFGARPDLTGWSKVLSVKLRSMKGETSNALQKHVSPDTMGPFGWIMADILPSMFLHARQRANIKTNGKGLSDVISEIDDD